jgi:gluconate 2-dehydrogenase alpha chain
MAQRLQPVDAVTIGVGLTGSMAALELAQAGLKVVGLERGAPRDTVPDFQSPAIHDELRFSIRKAMMQDNVKVAMTFRDNSDQTALPIRRWESFLPGQGLGGAFVHWNGQSFRFQIADFIYRTHILQRYGQKFLDACGPELTIQDWGVTYDELEPYYERFEKLCGTSGKPGNLRGQIVEGGNPFEGPRVSDYPNKPLIMSQAGFIFTDAAKKLGLHPFPTPSSNNSAPYTNIEGQTLGQCQYCGHCEYFGCESNSKASPNVCLMPVLMADPRFELRTHAYVKSLIYDKRAKKVRGVIYIDRHSGEEIEQPADLVILSAYPFNNVNLLLTAGIGRPYDPVTGRGVVGKNYCLQTMSAVQLFVADEINPFIGTGVNPAAVDDFQGDNFDHSGLGFFGGGYLYPSISGGRPIQVRATPPGTPRWGSQWKKATTDWYNHNFPISAHGSSYAWRTNYLDLDPNYKDAIGRPLTRTTFNYSDNDRKMSVYLTDRLMDIARAANAKIIGTPQPRTGNFDNIAGQSSHHTGGAIMGTDPRTSVINRYLQNWEASNLFVMGGAAFPQNPGYNPTGTIAALAYWSADSITKQYLKSPGPLMHA